MSFDPKSLVLYPEEPGVYLMKDLKDRVLYVGKAKNLKTRIKQYFHAKDQRQTVPFLISQVEKIETIVTLTEKDALLLENHLIKLHQPKYNILLKDDKTFISLMLTQHKWPMLKLVRYKGKPKGQGIFFGPYTSALAARQTFDLITKLFPLRQCSDSELMTRQRPCLLYDMKRCIAPCLNLCSEEEYALHVRSVVRLLRGQDQELLEELRKKMVKASSDLEFEKADDYLNMIRQLEHVTQKQHMEDPSAKSCDVIGLYRQEDAVLIALLLFREGKLISSEHFSFHLIVSTDVEVLESFLLQHYKNQTDPPSEIFLPLPLPEKQSIEEILHIRLLFPQKGKKKSLIEMAMRNAKALFVQEQDQKSLKVKKLLDLQETLQLSRFPKRIDCFDTSNLSGTDPVASLVCFIDGEKDSSKTRLFKIKQTEKADDYTAMKEVLLRAFSRQKQEHEFCDLLIVDGGKGQLNLAMDVLEELKIASVDVMGLSKENARHDRGLTQEKVYLPHRKDPLLIDPKSPLLFLLQKIRDEAHRTAINYHKKKRSQRTISSQLDEIEGIGPIKKKRLLQKFKSVERIKKASDEEILSVQGISPSDLKNLKKALS